MKNLIITLILLLSFIWTQCDANNDGELNVLDILNQVNCILDDCWESSEPLGNIYGYWMADSFNIAYTSPNGSDEYTILCGEFVSDQEDALVLNFNEDGQGSEWAINPSFCGLNEVDLSNPFSSASWSYSHCDDILIINIIDDYGNENPTLFTIEIIEQNRLVFTSYYVNDSYDYTQESTYNFHRIITPIEINTTILNLNNNVSPLDYKKYLNVLKK